MPSWIEGFLDYTSEIQSPKLFRKWAAVVAISAAMERKTWMKVFKSTLYPNLFVLLTGGPGVGKTEAIRRVRFFWNELPTLKIAGSSLSKASLIDEVNDAERTILRPMDIAPVQKFNSLQAGVFEFGTFLAKYESEFLSTLNDLWDNVPYRDRKRHMKNAIDIPKPQLNLLAGTTPAWLAGSLPETAWAEGFASRLLVVYSGDSVIVDPFSESAADESLEKALIHDLKSVHELWGQFHFEEEVVDAFRKWFFAGMPPEPDHPKLMHYLPRRRTHFLKLCMVQSAQRSDDLIIKLEDYQAAQSMFLEVEFHIPDTFKAMKTSSDMSVVDDCFAFIWAEWAKTNKPLSQHRIINFLAQRLPHHAVQKVLEIMVGSNIIEVANISGDKGQAMYRPVPRAQHGA